MKKKQKITNTKKSFQNTFIILLLFSFIAIVGIAFIIVRYIQAKPSVEGASTSNTKDAYEQLVNPFGQAWSSKQGNNSNINLVFATCYAPTPKQYIFPGFPTQLKNEEVSYIARLSSPLVFFDQCPALSRVAYSLTLYKNIAAQLHPYGKKVIGYFTPTKGGSDNNPDFNKTKKIFTVPTFSENWFVHNKYASMDISSRLAHKEAPYLMNVTDQSYRDYISSYIADVLKKGDIDGMLSDWVFSTDPPTPDVSLVPDDIRANWASGMVALFAEIKRKIGLNKLLFINHIRVSSLQNPAVSDIYLNFYKQLLQYADGAWYEEGDESYAFDFSSQASTANGFRAYDIFQKILDMTVNKGKYYILVLPTDGEFHISGGYTNTSYSQQQQLEKYFLAFYLTFRRNSYEQATIFTPVNYKNGENLNSEAYFNNTDVPLGISLNLPKEIRYGLFEREFNNGLTLWNNSTNEYTITLPYPILDESGKTIQGVYTISPKTGGIFLKSNVKITPTPTPTPSTCPTPKLIMVAYCGGENNNVSHIRFQWTNVNPNNKNVKYRLEYAWVSPVNKMPHFYPELSSQVIYGSGQYNGYAYADYPPNNQHGFTPNKTVYGSITYIDGTCSNNINAGFAQVNTVACP